MKKILVAVAVLLVTAGTLFAGEMTIGVRGALSLSGNKWADGEFKDTMDALVKSAKVYNDAKDERKGVIVGGGADVFFRYDFLDIPFSENLGFSLGVQPEIGIHAGWGANEKLSASLYFIGYKLGDLKANVDFTYNTLDIPILITAGLNISKVRVNIALGPNFGFVLGPKFIMSYETPMSKSELNDSVKADSPVLIGMQVGAGVSYNFTKNHGIVLEVRGIFDFTDLKLRAKVAKATGSLEEITAPITRRAGALISLGYAYTF